MKIAITGANGFVGKNLLQIFQSSGHEVTAIIRPSASPSSFPPHIEVNAVNYYSPESLSLAFAPFDVLIHNAGKTKAKTALEMYRANVRITENIVKAINTLQKPVHLIYISSQAASRPSYDNIPVKESDLPSPLTSYGRSKLAAEQLIQDTCTQPYTIIRPCSVYGGGDRDFLLLFRMVSKGISIKLGKVDRLLNMIHISELAKFISLCLLNSAAYGQVFFTTDGVVYKQSQVSSAIANALNKKTLNIVIPDPLVRCAFHIGEAVGRVLGVPMVVNIEKMREIMAESWLADIGKAKELLGWNPKPNLKLNMIETAECYKELGWL